MSKVIKLKQATGIWLKLLKAVNHPDYPESPKKFSGAFVFSKDQYPAVKESLLACIEELAVKGGTKLPADAEAKAEKLQGKYEAMMELSNSFPLYKQQKTFTDRNGKTQPNPDASKWTIKAKGSVDSDGAPVRPTLFIASPTGYVECPEDQIGKYFYDGGLYNVIIEVYVTKAKGIAANLRAVYWAGKGERRAASGYEASADDFEVPEGVFEEDFDDEPVPTKSAKQRRQEEAFGGDDDADEFDDEEFTKPKKKKRVVEDDDDFI
jgi:hypothetical protein